MSRCKQNLYQFSDRFWSELGPILAPKWEEIWHRIRRFLIIVFDVDPERLRKPFFCLFCIDVRPAKMSFLMQNHVFYRSFLIWQMRMKALQSGADDNKNGLQNQQQIYEKWSQNGSQNRSFFQWLRRRLSASILERFGTISGSMLRRSWGPKSIQKRLEKTSNKLLKKSHAR